MSTATKKVTVLGATGLVGQALIHQLKADERIARITVIVRPKHHLDAHEKIQCVTTDFRNDEWLTTLQTDCVFCCLGTTIKKAGSESAFRWVDHELVVKAAKIAAQSNAHFLVISALGADANSRVFYNRVKGEMEQDLYSLGLKKLSIFQPSLLTGARKELRVGERLAQLIMWLLPKQWRSISAEKVAAGMIRAAFTQVDTTKVYPSETLQ